MEIHRLRSHRRLLPALPWLTLDLHHRVTGLLATLLRATDLTLPTFVSSAGPRCVGAVEIATIGPAVSSIVSRGVESVPEVRFPESWWPRLPVWWVQIAFSLSLPEFVIVRRILSPRGIAPRLLLPVPHNGVVGVLELLESTVAPSRPLCPGRFCSSTHSVVVRATDSLVRSSSRSLRS